MQRQLPQRVLASALAVLVISAGVTAQSPSIPTLLKNAGEPLIHNVSIGSGLAPTVHDVLLDTDLIVRGTIGEPQSYLTDDQREVRTDYSVLGARLLSRRHDAIAKTESVPDILRVTLLGGEVSVGGLSYTSIHTALPSLQTGGDCLLLLKQTGEKYYVALRYYGAFTVDKDRLLPLTAKRGFATEYSNTPAEVAITDIVARLGKLRR